MDDEEYDEGPSGALMKIVLVVGLPVVFVICVADREWISAGIVALAGLALGLFYVWTSKVVRNAEALLEQLPDAPLREPSEAMLAVDAFDEAISDAPGVPFTDQVRLDRLKVDALVGRIRTALPRGLSELTSMVDALDELIQRAKPIPLTEQIRLDRGEVHDVLDRMRAIFAEDARD